VWAQSPSSAPARAISTWRGLGRVDAGTPAVWGLTVAVAFLHERTVHLAVNVALLLVLGVLVERRLGHARMLALVVAAGTASSALELLVTGEGKIGASGVVFALGAFLAASRRAEPALSVGLARAIVAGLGAWFVIALAATYLGRATYGNVAHAAGALLGWLAGWLGRARARRPA
jgi:membrane associated rhomboid family serine protease